MTDKEQRRKAYERVLAEVRYRLDLVNEAIRALEAMLPKEAE